MYLLALMGFKGITGKGGMFSPYQYGGYSYYSGRYYSSKGYGCSSKRKVKRIYKDKATTPREKGKKNPKNRESSCLYLAWNPGVWLIIGIISVIIEIFDPAFFFLALGVGAIATSLLSLTPFIRNSLFGQLLIFAVLSFAASPADEETG